jgi:hypothetical protein
MQDDLLSGLGNKIKVSIALDCRMSLNTQSFFGITGYYIFEDRGKKKLSLA